MEQRRLLFEDVLKSSNYVYGVAGGSRCSKSVLCLAQSLIYLRLDPIENELSIQLVEGIKQRDRSVILWKGRVSFLEDAYNRCYCPGFWKLSFGVRFVNCLQQDMQIACVVLVHWDAVWTWGCPLLK